jgi:AcrR family transcriptional regulator
MNDKRYKYTEELMETDIFNLLEKKGYGEFSVKDICKEAGINRTSFYNHYQDINDIMIKMEEKLARKMQSILIPIQDIASKKSDGSPDGFSFIGFFTFIHENRAFYKAFLKKDVPSFSAVEMLKKNHPLLKYISQKNNYKYSDEEINYHLLFFGGGLRTICKYWLLNNCKESPEYMAKIIYDEYANKMNYF